MGTISKIQWTNATYEPVLGCTRVSDGCRACYAEELIARRMGQNPMTPRYHGLAVINASGQPRWTGKVVPQTDHLTLPLHWKKPRRVFVCSRSDLFHPKVPLHYIASVFGVMANSPQHTYLVLTKRPERALHFFRLIAGETRELNTVFPYKFVNQMLRRYLPDATLSSYDWPLPNVHLGVSVENQEYAEERIPILLECPAAVRWISAEPLLGPVDLFAFLKAPLRDESLAALRSRPMPGLDWIVVGGESTHIKKNPARPCNVQWIRSIVQQCKDANVACFVKQLGSNAFLEEVATAGPYPDVSRRTWKGKGDDRALFPKDLQVFEYPEDARCRPL